MCIAIYKPAGIVIPEETLMECYKSNRDGCGFSYINTDNLGVKRMVIKKSMKYDIFLRQYRRATMTSPESPFLIHFRVKTHGQRNVDNCHPFYINDEVSFIHNGIITGIRKDDEMSDTRVFNEDVLKGLGREFYKNDAVIKLIESFIYNNKIIIMDIDGYIRILNEAKGIWDGGVWYSNSSYKTVAQIMGNYNKQYHYVSKRAKPEINKETLIRCEGSCKTWLQLKAMKHYYHNGLCYSFCTRCANIKVHDSIVNGITTSASCVVDFLSEGNAAVPSDGDSTFFQEWKNPWNESAY